MDFEAHLTDFGIAKSLCTSKTYTSTYIMGTIGYIDLEYARTSRLTEKSDVYNYGIVLLELLTGRKAVDDESNLRHLLALLCTKNRPLERPNMHEVSRVLCSLMPPPETKPTQPLLSSAKAPCYKDEYTNLKTPHLVNYPSMSTSDVQLFLKFGEVISQNSQ